MGREFHDIISNFVLYCHVRDCKSTHGIEFIFVREHYSTVICRRNLRVWPVFKSNYLGNVNEGNRSKKNSTLGRINFIETTWRHGYNGDTFQHFKNCLFETPSRRINFNSPWGRYCYGKTSDVPSFQPDCNVVSGKIVVGEKPPLYGSLNVSQIIFKFAIVFFRTSLPVLHPTRFYCQSAYFYTPVSSFIV